MTPRALESRFCAGYDSRTDLIGISASHKWSWSGIVDPTHWKRKEALRPNKKRHRVRAPPDAANLSTKTQRARAVEGNLGGSCVWPDVFLIVAAFRNGTIAIPGRLLGMTRDCWVEVLRCPRCGKTGEAQISAKDQLSWNFRVDAIPHGFKVIRIDVAHCGYFFCASCDVPVEP